MTNRQARINRLKAAFQKAEELMKDGYIVQWDGVTIECFNWVEGLYLIYDDWHAFTIYSSSGFQDMADLTIAEINKELAERLTVWKRVEIKL